MLLLIELSGQAATRRGCGGATCYWMGWRAENWANDSPIPGPPVACDLSPDSDVNQRQRWAQTNFRSILEGVHPRQARSAATNVSAADEGSRCQPVAFGSKLQRLVLLWMHEMQRHREPRRQCAYNNGRWSRGGVGDLTLMAKAQGCFPSG